MHWVKRIYVEKRDRQMDTVLLRELRQYLGIERADGLRTLLRYDVEGDETQLDPAFDTLIKTIFSEPPVDLIYKDDFPHSEKDFIFAVKYLPGQYDQRADSAVFCAKMAFGGSDTEIAVETANVYVVSGELTDSDKDKLRRYFINPVDQTEAGGALPQRLNATQPEASDVSTLTGFRQLSDEGLSEILNSLELAMNRRDLELIRDRFKDEGRDPTETEIKVLDTYWSDHCRHVTFHTELTDVSFEDGPYKDAFVKAYDLYQAERRNVYGPEAADRPVTLMDVALMGMKSMKRQGLLKDLDESEEVNAAGIITRARSGNNEDDWLILFKNETHNHPTEIEPYGGAATCLGGAIRDPLSGRGYVYQAMRVTGAADPREAVEDTLPGKLPQRKLTQTAAQGFSAYGNQVGLATGLVSEIYHPGYKAKRMELGAVVGAVKKKNLVRQSPEKGDLVILVGGRTGRDGIGGATGSSKAHTDESILRCGAQVQKGNPPTERALQRLFRNPAAARLIKRCNDFGAGGVAVAVGELADGLDINLDNILLKYTGLNGTELALSESQERMAVVTAAKDADTFIEAAWAENLEATVIAEVTDASRLRMTWRGRVVADLPRDLLNSGGAKRRQQVLVTSPVNGFPKAEVGNGAKTDLKTRWLSNLSRLNVSCQKGLSERFDSVVGAGTVLMPFGGTRQLTPIQAMAAKLPTDNDTDTCTLMSYGYDPELSSWSPFHGAAAAVVESVAKVVAAGGSLVKTRLSFQEYFGKPGEDPRRMGAPLASLLGGFLAQSKLKTPAIGGKDSMSGSFGDMDVPPTLVSFAIAPESVETVISPELKGTGHVVGMLRCGKNKDGLVDFSKFIGNVRAVERYIREKRIVAAYAVGTGGAAAAVSVMAFGNGIGLNLRDDLDIDWFSQDYGGFVVELPMDIKTAESVFRDVDFVVLGETVNNEAITAGNMKITQAEALESWISPLEGVFPTGLLNPEQTTAAPNVETVRFLSRADAATHQEWINRQAKTGAVDKPERRAGQTYSPEQGRPGITVQRYKPKVLITVFPGTNSEYDTRTRFELAGAQTELLIFRNLSKNALAESLNALAYGLSKADIMVIPGGFSAGDEPDGSGKYIAATFRTPVVAAALTEFLNKRGGLILGICNGFQALIKLGLLPYGEIREQDENAPTLTYNAIGRHVSTLARTMATSSLSPWFALCRPGDVFHLPVSHGEGRFVAAQAEFNRLRDNGQIAGQYVDLDGNATMDIRYNPCGSMYAVEALTSPDGRILGKMGHSERIGGGVYKNVPGVFDQKIFEAAVRYFS